jgi:hypothetical protein
MDLGELFLVLRQLAGMWIDRHHRQQPHIAVLVRPGSANAAELVAGGTGTSIEHRPEPSPPGLAGLPASHSAEGFFLGNRGTVPDSAAREDCWRQRARETSAVRMRWVSEIGMISPIVNHRGGKT